MAFFARPNLDDTQFKQLKGSELTLSGQTQIATTTGLTLIGDGGTYIPIQATGASNNFVLTYYDDGVIPVIKLKESSASGGTTTYPYNESATTTVGGLVAGENLYNEQVVDILHDILVPTLYPTLTNPSISSFTISPSTTLYEVGYCAFGAMNLLQADKMDSASWLDPRGTMSVKLDITGGSAGTAYIVTQQERLY